MVNERLHLYYIFCYWIWTVSLLYLLKIYPSPPIVSLAAAAIFTFFYAGAYARLDMFVLISLWEFGMLFIVYYTWRRRGGVWGEYSLGYDLFLFSMYLLFLSTQDHVNMREVYFVHNKKFHDTFKGSKIDYIRAGFRI